jgi:hypothetical protein
VLGFAAVDGGYFPRWWGLGTIALACAAAASLLLARNLSLPRAAVSLVAALSALAAFVALSALWSPSVPLTLLELERSLVYVAAAGAAVVLARRRPDALLHGVLAAAVAVACWNLIDRAGRFGDEIDLGARGVVAEPIGYENALGALCAIGLALVVALRLDLRVRVAAALPLLVALWLSGNRGGWLALAVALVVLSLARSAPAPRRAVAAAAVFVVVALGAAVAFAGTDRHAYWRAAVDQGAGAPLVGGGAGSFARHWLDVRDVSTDTRDAHGLFLEAFAELGVAGLALLALALAPPLALARRDPAAAAALTAFVVHAAFDWDWEMPAVALAGVFAAAALTLRDDRQVAVPTVPRLAAAGAAIGLTALALVPFAGQAQLAGAEAAFRLGRADQAVARAERAERLLPWSPEPHLLAALVHQQRGFLPQARAELRLAIEHDPTDAQLWRVLATVTRGDARREALERADRLDPLGAPPRF